MLISKPHTFWNTPTSFGRALKVGAFVVEEIAMQKASGRCEATVLVAGMPVHGSEHPDMGSAKARLERITPGVVERVAAAFRVVE